jgi:serine/threonine protein phosphatase PrpC
MVFRTTDHSYVQTLVNQGELTEEEAMDHPHSNILMGCLGTDNEPPVDIHVVPHLSAGDTLMACSDGIWHYFTPLELASAVTMLSPREACEFLIQKARSRAKGMGDNLSLTIVKLEPLS